MQRVVLGAVVVIVVAVVIAAAGAGGAGGAPPDAPGAVTVEHDIAWRTVDGIELTLDAYLPAEDGKGRPPVVLVHGGGWRMGDKATLARQGGQLAELGYVAFSVGYRLAPDHLYPAAVEDVQAAVEWVRKPKQVKTYGVDPDRIGALGSSAGGHLVGMLATLGDGARNDGARIRAAVSWSGPMDFLDVQSSERIRRSGAVATFLGCEPTECVDKAAEASPISQVDGSDAPILLVNSTLELVPAAQAESMAAALDDAGVAHQLVLIEGTKHARALAPDVWDETVAFLERHLGRPRS